MGTCQTSKLPIQIRASAAISQGIKVRTSLLQQRCSQFATYQKLSSQIESCTLHVRVLLKAILLWHITWLTSHIVSGIKHQCHPYMCMYVRGCEWSLQSVLAPIQMFGCTQLIDFTLYVSCHCFSFSIYLNKHLLEQEHQHIIHITSNINMCQVRKITVLVGFLHQSNEALWQTKHAQTLSKLMLNDMWSCFKEIQGEIALRCFF